MTDTSLDISDLNGKVSAVLLPLLLLLLIVGRGSSAPSASQLLAERLLQLVPIYPGAVSTSRRYPHPTLMLPSEPLVEESSEYLMPAGVREIETWYANHLKSLGWRQTGSESSKNERTGVISGYGIEFTSKKYPLVYAQLSLERLSQDQTLTKIVVANAETPRPSPTYLSQSFNRATVTIYMATTTMVPKKTTLYLFLLKETKKHVISSYIVTDPTVVHKWVKMLNGMPVAPKSGAISCNAIGADTKLIQVVFTSSSSTHSSMTVSMSSNCDGDLPHIGSTTLWDPTGSFWTTVNQSKSHQQAGEGS